MTPASLPAGAQRTRTQVAKAASTRDGDEYDHIFLEARSSAVVPRTDKHSICRLLAKAARLKARQQQLEQDVKELLAGAEGGSEGQLEQVKQILSAGEKKVPLQPQTGNADTEVTL